MTIDFQSDISSLSSVSFSGIHIQLVNSDNMIEELIEDSITKLCKWQVTKEVSDLVYANYNPDTTEIRIDIHSLSKVHDPDILIIADKNVTDFQHIDYRHDLFAHISRLVLETIIPYLRGQLEIYRGGK